MSAGGNHDQRPQGNDARRWRSLRHSRVRISATYRLTMQRLRREKLCPSRRDSWTIEPASMSASITRTVFEIANSTGIGIESVEIHSIFVREDRRQRELNQTTGAGRAFVRYGGTPFAGMTVGAGSSAISKQGRPLEWQAGGVRRSGCQGFRRAVTHGADRAKWSRREQTLRITTRARATRHGARRIGGRRGGSVTSRRLVWRDTAQPAPWPRPHSRGRRRLETGHRG